MSELTVAQWREAILAGWKKWGTGTPLDPRTVEHLAKEFAKPIRFPIFEWHGKEPFVEFGTYNVQWHMTSVPTVNSALFAFGDYWWDGSCRTTALAKEGPKAMVLYNGGGK